MDFKTIIYGSDEYRQMVDLRHRILRAPINSVATEEELAEDQSHILLGAFFPNGGEIVACCFLTHISEKVARLRQMAVDTHYQKKCLGAELIDYAESIASDLNYKWMYLHARKTAVDFYKKQGYQIEGDYFEEVGIPHIEMMKNIEF